MSTYAEENAVLELVKPLMLVANSSTVLPKKFEIVDSRLYWQLEEGKYIMVDPETNRVKVVYNKTGEFRRNFECRPAQIAKFMDELKRLL